MHYKRKFVQVLPKDFRGWEGDDLKAKLTSLTWGGGQVWENMLMQYLNVLCCGARYLVNKC